MAAVVNETLATRMSANVGRHADKVPDWDAFPGSRGYPELARSQIRYIGAGGSPKIDDPSTLKPFKNDGLTDAQFMMIVGTPQPEDVRFQAA